MINITYKIPSCFKIILFLAINSQLLISQDLNDIIITTQGSTGDNTYGSYNITTAAANNYTVEGGITVSITNPTNFSTTDEYYLKLQVGVLGKNPVNGTPDDDGIFEFENIHAPRHTIS